MIHRNQVAFTFLLLVFSAMTVFEQTADSVAAVHEGIWRSEGADMLVVGGGKYTTYFVTAISCVESDSGIQTDVTGLFPKINMWSDEILQVSGYDWTEKYRRQTDLPAQCRRTDRLNDPVYNFDVFWQYFAENYPSFARRKIDWDSIRSEFRPQIREGTGSPDLMKILGAIVERINDPHVFVTNALQGNQNVSFGSPDPHGLAATLRQANPGKTTNEYRSDANKVEQAIDTSLRYELLHGKFKTANNDRFLWGMLPSGVGYLRNSQSFGLFAPGTSREEMYKQLDASLDRAFTDLKEAKALVIDVTMNTGGASFVTDAIARRVINEEIVGYTFTIQTPKGQTDRFVQSLRPADGVRFRGPVIVLISQNTVSAGEGLPLVLHGLPNVTIYGEPTLGSTSSFTMFKLPNGWQLGIPNYIASDRHGNWLEVTGVSPDIRARVFDPEKIVSGYLDFVRSASSIALRKLKNPRR